MTNFHRPLDPSSIATMLQRLDGARSSSLEALAWVHDYTEPLRAHLAATDPEKAEAEIEEERDATKAAQDERDQLQKRIGMAMLALGRLSDHKETSEGMAIRLADVLAALEAED